MLQQCSILSAIFIVIMIFVHWKKGSPKWTKVSPYIFLTLLILDFFVLPTLVVLWTVIGSLILLESDSYTYTYIFFFTSMNFWRLVEFVMYIGP